MRINTSDGLFVQLPSARGSGIVAADIVAIILSVEGSVLIPTPQRGSFIL